MQSETIDIQPPRTLKNCSIAPLAQDATPMRPFFPDKDSSK